MERAPSKAMARQRSERLHHDLSRDIRGGIWKAGDPLPTLEQLARTYGISRTSAHGVMSRLEDSHLVYRMKGVGAFVGSPGIAGKRRGILLRLRHRRHYPHTLQQMGIGFEERAMAEGFSTLLLSYEQAMDLAHAGGLPAVAGVFESCRTQDDRVLPELGAALFGSGPRVRFCIRENGCPDADAVRFDQVGGGRQATQHLLEAGHTRIAVLALHTPAGGHIWSRERTTGWREAMRQAGLPADDSSVIMPPGVADIAVGDDGRPLAARAAAELVQRQEITAVVAVTDEAARALITCLQESGRSQDAWPAIVGFDDTETAAALGFTSLRQPWESLGQEAVALMSDRLSGTLAGPPVTRFIPLRLVNRMTSTQARYSLVSALLSASCC